MQKPIFGTPSGNYNIAIGHVNHVSFLFCGQNKTRIIVDPFLKGYFHWQGHIERQLDSPGYTPADIGECSAVLITHIHADHFEADTVATLCNEYGASLYCGVDVAQNALQQGIFRQLINTIDAEQVLEVAGAKVYVLPNAGSEDQRPCLRFSFGIEIGGCMIFHSGDSHGPSDSWAKMPKAPDIACIWPSHIEETIRYFKPKRVLLMHTQRFEPGDFLCNIDHQALQQDLSEKFPDVQVSYLDCGEFITGLKT